MNYENPLELMCRQGWLPNSRVKIKIQTHETSGNSKFVLLHDLFNY